jgi:hypothetical protein
MQEGLAGSIVASWVRAALLATPILLGAGCATYQDELSSGERAFEASEHERALAIFRALEPDTGRLSTPDRARYAYLRGMTDYRIGYKADARHWLAVASATEEQTPGSLPEDWTKRMTESLRELNEEVFAVGIESLSSAAPARSRTSDDTTPTDTDPPPAPPRPRPRDKTP